MSAESGAKKKRLPPFVEKLYAMVDDPKTDHIIVWSSSDSFVVHRVEELTADILPVYFKHSNFCSFLRQINTYGFTKTRSDTWEFQNSFFARGGPSPPVSCERMAFFSAISFFISCSLSLCAGRPELLERIKRRTAVKRNSKQEESTIHDENRLSKMSKTDERVQELIRENQKLSEELQRVQQESVTNEQLVKQFLTELRACKHHQHEMQEREGKLLNMLRGMVSKIGDSSVQPRFSSQDHHHEEEISSSMPDASIFCAEDMLNMPHLASSDTDFCLEEHMVKLGLSTGECSDGNANAEQPRPHHTRGLDPFFLPSHQPTPTRPSELGQISPLSPPSPFSHWTSAPPSPYLASPTPFKSESWFPTDNACELGLGVLSVKQEPGRPILTLGLLESNSSSSFSPNVSG